MQTLIDVFMTPECAPDVPYAPESDVISWSLASDAAVDSLSEAQARASSFLDSKNIQIEGQWHPA